jgi:plasmid stabilization system protein ParE
MTKSWHFHPEAHEELIEAAEYYEQKKPGLGDAFVRRVEAALNQLESAPASAAAMPHVDGELKARRGFVSRFPYAIVFVELESEFQIVAVAHLHRRPGYWGLRLKRLLRPAGASGRPCRGSSGAIRVAVGRSMLSPDPPLTLARHETAGVDRRGAISAYRGGSGQPGRATERPPRGFGQPSSLGADFTQNGRTPRQRGALDVRES